MNSLTLVSTLSLLGLASLAQETSSLSGVHRFDLRGAFHQELPLPLAGVPIDAIRFAAASDKGRPPLRARMIQGRSKGHPWKAVSEPAGRWRLSASKKRFALRRGDEHRLLLTRTEKQTDKGSYVLLSREHRYLGKLVFQEGQGGSAHLPIRIPEKGRIVFGIQNATVDLPLHEIELGLPASWTQVKWGGDRLHFIPAGSNLILDPPLLPGRSCALYLDVEQRSGEARGAVAQGHGAKGADQESSETRGESGAGTETLGFRPVFVRSRLRFLRAPDPRSKRLSVQVVKKLPSTLTLPALELGELRPDSLGEEVVLKADANFRFVEGTGVLSASSGKERVRPRLRAEGRELVFAVKKAGQKRRWKLLSVKVRIQPDAFGLLQFYILDGKTWLTRPFAELH